jgi:hypothetical protein
VEGYREPVVGGVESVQPVRILEMTVCRRNLCVLLQSCRLASVGQKVLGPRL